MVKIDSAEAFEQHLQKKYKDSRIPVQTFEKLSRQFTRIMIADKLRAYFYFRLNILNLSFEKLTWLEKYRITVGDEVMKELIDMNADARFNKLHKDKIPERRAILERMKHIIDNKIEGYNLAIRRHNDKYRDNLEEYK